MAWLLQLVPPNKDYHRNRVACHTAALRVKQVHNPVELLPWLPNCMADAFQTVSSPEQKDALIKHWNSTDHMDPRSTSHLISLSDDLVELVQLSLLGSNGGVSLLHLSSRLVHLKPQSLTLPLHLHSHQAFGFRP